MWDAEGQRYIDYIGSWGPMILGHGHPAVLDAVHKAALDGLSFGAPTEREIELAEEIIRLVPSVEQVRLVSSGTEAGMSALRLARGATGRSKIIKFEGCYHGHADALLVKAGSGLATFGFPTSAGVPAEVVQHTLVLEYNNLAQLDEAFAIHGHELACVMIEPIAGNMNFVRASRALHDAAARAVHEARRAAGLRRGDDGFPRRARRRAERLCEADPRLQARHERVRQGHRRRHAAGGLRRQQGRDEPAGAARPGVPGRHAERQPGGHRLRAGHAEGNHQARLLRGAVGQDPVTGRRPDRRGARRPACRWSATAKAACSASSSPTPCRRTTASSWPPTRSASTASSTPCSIAACTWRRRCTRPASSARRTAPRTSPPPWRRRRRLALRG